jgi:hypothetical protein
MLEMRDGSNLIEQQLVTQATDAFADAVTRGFGRIGDPNFRTAGQYRVTYVSAQSAYPVTGEGLPRLEITASGIDALFYVRNVNEQPGQREVARAILLPKDPDSSRQDIGAQRILSQVEIATLIGIAESPRVDSIEGFGLLEISQSEQSQIDNAKRKLILRKQKEKLEALGRVALGYSSGVLKTVPVMRPARPE